MRFLLDSHVLLWTMIQRDVPLTGVATQAITDSEAKLFISVASLWEIGIKHAKGKLPLPADFFSRIEQADATILSVVQAHALAAAKLPFFHADPFDRMLVAQALSENLTLVTRDSGLARYGIKTLLA